ncbi:MAG TPA: hypothetical protein VGM89_16475 [Puia sp.]|jgi:hypothetical protein
MIEGPIDLKRLEPGTRATLYILTRDVLLELLRPEWTRTVSILHLAHRYFPDLSWPEEGDSGISGRLAATLEEAQPNIHDYFSFVLLDFIHADPSLEDRLRARALTFAEAAGLLAVYHQLKSE